MTAWPEPESPGQQSAHLCWVRAPQTERDAGPLASDSGVPYPVVGWEVEGTTHKGDVLWGFDVSNVRGTFGAWKPEANVAS